jgi:hypothetical protein
LQKNQSDTWSQGRREARKLWRMACLGSMNGMRQHSLISMIQTYKCWIKYVCINTHAHTVPTDNKIPRTIAWYLPSALLPLFPSPASFVFLPLYL